MFEYVLEDIKDIVYMSKNLILRYKFNFSFFYLLLD